MDNRNRDRENLKGDRQRESGLGSTSSPGSSKSDMDRSTRGNLGSSSNVGGSQSGSRGRNRDEQSDIGSPGRSSDLESDR